MSDQPVLETTRIDSAASPGLTALARLGADTFGYRAELDLDPELAQLLRLRVAQINNCTYCMNLHYEAARDLGIARERIDTLTAWWETALFTGPERAALAYAEALTRASDTTVASRFQPFHDDLADHFADDAILEIIGVVINMNIWTRLKLAEGSMPR